MTVVRLLAMVAIVFVSDLFGGTQPPSYVPERKQLLLLKLLLLHYE